MAEQKFTTTEIVYRWPSGDEEVRYRRPFGSMDALNLIEQVEARKKICDIKGEECPYSFRHF